MYRNLDLNALAALNGQQVDVLQFRADCVTLDVLDPFTRCDSPSMSRSRIALGTRGQPGWCVAGEYYVLGSSPWP